MSGFSNDLIGNLYCKNWNKDKIECVMCIEQAIFKIKSCYKDAKK